MSLPNILVTNKERFSPSRFSISLAVSFIVTEEQFKVVFIVFDFLLIIHPIFWIYNAIMWINLFKMKTVKIPQQGFYRRILCLKCRDLTLHSLFFMETYILKGVEYSEFRRKCLQCEDASYETLLHTDFKALVENKYL